MKISKILVHRPNREFFWDDDMITGLCVPFISKFVGKVPDWMNTAVSVNFSTNNPKKKGFRKILRSDDAEIKFNNKAFQICGSEIRTLDNAGIETGDSFWLKVEKVG